MIEMPLSVPGRGEVLLEVRAAGVNPIDWKLYRDPSSFDAVELPARPGFEAAGVVLSVGAKADGPAGPVRVGDEVIAFPVEGAYATEVVAAASSVLPKPRPLSFEQASGLMLAGSTAVHALTVTRVASGETIVIHGAAGGVGLMAVQLARISGARVIGTASESSHASLRELGAEPVAYGPGLLGRIQALARDGVDVAVDAVGGYEALDTSLTLVAARDRIVTLLASPEAFGAGIRVIGNAPGADPGNEIRAQAKLELVRVAEQGKLRVAVAATYALARAAVAHKAIVGRHPPGKIILIP